VEAIASLRLIGRQGQVEAISAVVDTGFTGELTLPPSAMRDFNYNQFGTYEITLSDGSTVEVQVFEGLIDWFGKKQSILVLQTDSDALLGMKLMRDCRLTMDIVPDGPFTIVPLETTKE
jgi:clan AA aspartic protease